jgi:hypothetical protein
MLFNQSAARAQTESWFCKNYLLTPPKNDDDDDTAHTTTTTPALLLLLCLRPACAQQQLPPKRYTRGLRVIRHSSNNGSIEIDDARAKQTNPNQTKHRRANLGKGKGGRAKQSKGSQPAGPFCTAPDRPGHATPPGPSLAPLPITYHLSLSPSRSLPLSLARITCSPIADHSFIHSFLRRASGARIN